MAASQMNIRMDNMLKQSGNAALSSLGITPSQAVRALWEFLTIQQTLPSELLRLLHPKEDPHATEFDSGHEGARLVARFYEMAGIPEPNEDPLDYDELKELAAAEQLEKWDLS